MVPLTAAPHRGRADGARYTRRAWWSLLGLVPAFVLAFVVGEGLISALGYPTGGTVPAPWWAALVAGVPALVVFAIPAVVTVHLGRQAIRRGDARARTPMLVAVVVTAGFVLLNALPALVSWLS